jgi:folate-binding protein YgfZ
MNPAWRAFLLEQGAEIDADGGVRLPEDAPRNLTLFDLSHLGLIAAQGPDTDDFLQGQLTNDVRELTQTHTQLSSHLSPKGRMLASFRMIRIGETVYLQLPRERLADIQKRLRMFVLRARVTLEDASDALVRIGLAGETAADALAAVGLPAPAADGAADHADGVTVIRLPAPVPRFELIAAPEHMIPRWQQLRPLATQGGPDGWALLDIRAGIPNVYTETVETFVPQMANLQLIDGVSFHKGCYAGQEVVARMQYLGKLKRRMYVAEVASATPPRPGDQLHSPGSSSAQAPGWVVDARPIGDGRHALLAVVEIDAAEAGDVHLGPDGPRITLTPPPYGFATDTALPDPG